ncbi:hypothetical protein [Streptomyces viridosporus]|nr:hypothetical protein [Streptomyces viridosporus]
MTNPETPTVTPDPDRDGVILHLPEITYLDTQTWAVDVGLTAEGLAALRAALGVPAVVEPPADRSALRCVCGDPIERWTGPGEPGWIHSPGSDARCLEARPPAGRSAVYADAARTATATAARLRTEGHETRALGAEDVADLLHAAARQETTAETPSMRLARASVQAMVDTLQRPADWGVCSGCGAAAGPDCDCPPFSEQRAQAHAEGEHAFCGDECDADEAPQDGAAS